MASWWSNIGGRLSDARARTIPAVFAYCYRASDWELPRDDDVGLGLLVHASELGSWQQPASA